MKSNVIIVYLKLIMIILIKGQSQNKKGFSIEVYPSEIDNDSNSISSVTIFNLFYLYRL